jgi:hypothetical protein
VEALRRDFDEPLESLDESLIGIVANKRSRVADDDAKGIAARCERTGVERERCVRSAYLL